MTDPEFIGVVEVELWRAESRTKPAGRLVRYYPAAGRWECEPSCPAAHRGLVCHHINETAAYRAGQEEEA